MTSDEEALTMTAELISAGIDLHFIDVGGETTSAAYDPAPNGDHSAVFVCAHGAGGSGNDARGGWHC